MSRFYLQRILARCAVCHRIAVVQLSDSHQEAGRVFAGPYCEIHGAQALERMETTDGDADKLPPVRPGARASEEDGRE